MQEKEVSNYTASYVGFKRKNLSDEQREMVDAMTEETVDMTHVYSAMLGCCTLGLKVSVKPLYIDWYAADVMMLDKDHPAAGYMLRSESDTPEKALYSLYLKLQEAKWDFASIPNADMKKVRMTR